MISPISLFPSMSDNYELNPKHRRTFFRDLRQITEDMPDACDDLNSDGDWLWDFAFCPSRYRLDPIEESSPAFAVMVNAVAFSGMLLRATKDISFVDTDDSDISKRVFELTICDGNEKLIANALRPIGDRIADIDYYFQRAIEHVDLCFRVHRVVGEQVTTIAYETAKVLEVKPQVFPMHTEYSILIEVDTFSAESNTRELDGDMLTTAPIPVRVRDELHGLDVGRLTHLISVEGPDSKLFRQSCKLVLDHVANQDKPQFSKHSKKRSASRSKRRNKR